jgi:hypothetical protein
MSADARSSDDEKLAEIAAALADGIDEALPRWVERSVERLLVQWRPDADERVMEAARVAAIDAQNEITPKVRALLASDIDDQRANPLALVREGVRFPTQVLQQAGVPSVVRDAFAEKQFPDDLYDLTPVSFADLDPELHEIGIAWGAAKAYVHLRRRRDVG